MLVLCGFPHFPEACVIAVLLTALRIPAGGLDVAVGKWANPDVGPSRRDRQSLDSSHHITLREPRPVRPGVRDSFTRLLASYTRAGIRNISQACGLGGVLRIGDRLRAIRRVD